MGFSKKHHQVEGGVKDSLEGAATKWVIAGISIRAPLKSISIKPKDEFEDDDDENSPSTTPRARESKIPERLPCPPAPRKRRPNSTCHFNGVREFFNPPDLESVFVRHVERAN